MAREEFLLFEPICAVRLAGEKQTATVLAAGATVTILHREPSIAGMTDVECGGREYAIFEQDLLCRANSEA